MDGALALWNINGHLKCLQGRQQGVLHVLHICLYQNLNIVINIQYDVNPV